MKTDISRNIILFLFGIQIIFSAFLISCEKEVSTSPEEKPIPQGFIYVDSKPRNFQIHVDGRFTGSYTPDLVPYIPEQPHSLKLERKFWKDTSITVDLSVRPTDSVYINLLLNNSMYGDIEVNSTPEGASIYLNDSLLNMTTPAVIEHLIPGRYKLKVNKFSYRGTEEKVEVYSSAVTKINSALQDTSIWVDYTHENSPIPSSNYTVIAIDNNNNVWAGTREDGLVVFKNGTWEVYNTSNTILPSDGITAIQIDENNRKWVGTFGGLAVFDDPQNMTIYNEFNSPLPYSEIGAVEVVNSDLVWVGTSQGLLKFEGADITLFGRTESNKLPPNQIVNSIAQNSQNRLWVGLDSLAYVFLYQNSFILLPRESYGFPTDDPNDIKISSDNFVYILWAPQEIKWFDFFGNKHSQVFNGGVSVASLDEGKITELEWEHITFGSGLTRMNQLMEDEEGSMWVASSLGLFRLGFPLAISEQFRTTNSPMITNEINALALDKNGSIWMATDKGIMKFKKNLLP